MDLMKIEIIDENLKLRPIVLSDKDDIFREFTEEIVTYMYPPVPKDIEETIDFVESSIATMEAGLNIQLCIVDNNTDEFLGCVGLHRIDKDIPEFGIWVKKSAQGRKIGRKSIHMLYNYACKHLNKEYFKYPVDKRNIPSRKIPESLGGEIYSYEVYERPVGDPLDTAVYHIPVKKNI